MNFDILKDIELYLNNPSKFLKDSKDYVNQNSVVVANIVIILIGFSAMVFIVAKSLNQYQSLMSREEMLNSKRQPMLELKQSNKALTDYIHKMPLGLAKADFIAYITGRATARRITIDAFDPLQASDEGFYRSVIMSFKASAVNVKDMLLFVHDVESSGYMIKLDKLFLGNNAINSGVQTGAMTFDISISLFRLVEDNDQKNSKKK